MFLILGGFLIGSGDWSHFSAKPLAPWEFNDWKTAGLSLMWIMFAYSGWNASVYIGSEIKNPLKNIPRSLLLGTVVVISLYVLTNLLFIYAIEPVAMEGVISIGALAANNLFGPRAESWLSLLIGFALFSSVSAFIILGPRVYYAMARDGHFFKFAASINEKNKVPVYSILFQAVISIIIILTGTLDQIFTYMGFSLSVFPLFVVLGLFKLRKSGQSLTRLPGFPAFAVLYLIAGVAMLVLSFMQRPVESGIAIGTIISGIPLYYLFKKGTSTE
jgi:APA family basic amino acid/polyamine antiporter